MSDRICLMNHARIEQLGTAAGDLCPAALRPSPPISSATPTSSAVSVDASLEAVRPVCRPDMAASDCPRRRERRQGRPRIVVRPEQICALGRD